MREFNAGGGLVLISIHRDKKQLVYIVGDPRCTIDYYQREGDRCAVVGCLCLLDSDLTQCRYRAVVDSSLDEIGAVEYVLAHGVEGRRKKRKIRRRRAGVKKK